jgi:hypothetical protein
MDERKKKKKKKKRKYITEYRMAKRKQEKREKGDIAWRVLVCM